MRGLSTMPARRPGGMCGSRRPLRRAPGAAGLPSTLAPVVKRRGVLGRWRERARGAIPFSREEQFRLLQVGLRIKLRHEGKPEDAIVLRRPDDLPAPAGTPVRVGGRQRGGHGDEQRAGATAGARR
jgi:hypothetical protein